MKANWITGAMAAALLAAPVWADDYSYPPAPPPPATTSTSTTTTTTEPALNPPITPTDQDKTVVEEHTYTTTAPAIAPVPIKREEPKMRGATFMLGGGVEGYSGTLAPQVRAGPSWGVRMGIKPTK